MLDVVREVRPPFSPSGVVGQFATTLKSYGISTVVGDRYAGEWPREQFKQRGITYLPADKPKSDLYLDVLAPINSGQVDLLDHDRLVAQLVGLERRTSRAGRDSIDHAPNGHDDIANAVASAVHLVLARPQPRMAFAAPTFVGGASETHWVGGEVPSWPGR